MDILAIIIGFIIGVLLSGIAVELTLKKSAPAPASRYTKEWSISEIENPKIMAEYLLKDVEIPKNSKVIVNKYKDKEILEGLNVREHKGVKGNYIVGTDRALIISGPIKKDELAFWTIEKEIIAELNREFDEMWEEATPLKKEEKK